MLTCRLLVIILFLVGIAIDLWLIGRISRGTLTCPFKPLESPLRHRPFTPRDVAIALGATLAFALPAAWVAGGPVATPTLSLLVSNGLLALFVGLGAIAAIVYFPARDSSASEASGAFARRFWNPATSFRRAIGVGLVLGLALVPPTALATWLCENAFEALGLPADPQPVFEWLKTISGWRPWLVMAALVLVTAPLTEELLFRGVLLPATLARRQSPLMPVLLVGFYFGLVHIHAPSLLPLIFLSACFSSGYAATGCILTPMLMHAIFNGSSLLCFFAGF